MTAPTSLLCAPWATEQDLPANAPTLTSEEWARFLMVSSEVLWALSGRQWSGATCAATAEWRGQGPCTFPTWPGGVAPSGMMYLGLPHDEVTEVLSVTINGVAFAAWRQQGPWLVRTDGPVWSGVVVVTYEWGLAPPLGGVLAAAAFAVELAKAATGDSSCRLPKRVSSITRQNVTMTLVDPQTYLKEGRTGLSDVDQWLVSVNPGGHVGRSSAWSPDVAWAYPL